MHSGWTFYSETRGQVHGISTSHQVTVDITEGRFTSNISISWSNVNKNTSILCTACVIQGQDVLNSPAFFKVQGLLGPPPSLSLSAKDLSRSQDDLVKILTWDEPDTLDVEPDVSYYRVCYNFSTTLMCKNTDREFTFLNISVNVLFTVTAVNVVGEGNGSTVMLPCSLVNMILAGGDWLVSLAPQSIKNSLAETYMAIRNS